MKQILVLICITLASCRHKTNHKKFIHYKDTADIPCQIKSGTIGYAIGYTDSLDEEESSGYRVELKAIQTKVSLTPDTLIMKPIHDDSLIMKSIRVMDISKINMPSIWADIHIKQRCFQLIADKHASLLEVIQTTSVQPLGIEQVDINLCFNDDHQRDRWAQAILDMKECNRTYRVTHHKKDSILDRRMKKEKKEKKEKKN